MNTPSSAEQLGGHRAEKSPIARFAGRVGLAATCVIPAADLAFSDTAVGKIYQLAQEHAYTSVGWFNHIAPDLAASGFIVAQSVALGVAIAKNKRLQGAAEGLGAYNEAKQGEMRGWRRLASVAINAPFERLYDASSAIDRKRNELSDRRPRAAKFLSGLRDWTLVNGIGTSGVALQETSAGKPPSAKRMAYLSGLIAGTWIAGAEAVRGIYSAASAVKQLPQVAPGAWSTVEAIPSTLHALGRTFGELTAVSISNPASTWVGITAVTLGAGLLGRYGWNIGGFQEQRERQLAAQPSTTGPGLPA